jgi:hypothetical protein
MNLAQRIRDNVARSRRTTSEILGAAAELVQGHELVLEQLSSPLPSLRKRPWTKSSMQKEFGSLKVARDHFSKLYSVKAASWDALVDKVNTIESALIHLGYRQR